MFPGRTKVLPDSETGGRRRDTSLRNMAHSPKEAGRTMRNRTLSPEHYPTLKRVTVMHRR